jgi:hypothetical protein
MKSRDDQKDSVGMGRRVNDVVVERVGKSGTIELS